MPSLRSLSLALLVTGALAWQLSTALAHGVHPHVSTCRAVVVEFGYENHQPMADERFEVRAPRQESPFLSGQTDPLGRAVFCPDRVGEWTVRVFSQDGHGATATVTVDEAMIAGTAPHQNAHAEDGQTPNLVVPGGGIVNKLALGIGVLLGIFGVVAILTSRNK